MLQLLACAVGSWTSGVLTVSHLHSRRSLKTHWANHLRFIYGCKVGGASGAADPKKLTWWSMEEKNKFSLEIDFRLE